jgi:hypothetical protein
VIIWAAISWYSAGPIITLHGRITASDYVDIFGNQVHPTVQMWFPNNDAIFQDDNSPIHTSRCIQSWFEEHEDALQHLLWPGKSPHLNIIELIRSVLQSTVRRRFHLPSPRKQLDVLHAGCYSIPLEAIRYLHESIPRRIHGALQANGGQTPY